jgi:hypothetical protein
MSNFGCEKILLQGQSTEYEWSYSDPVPVSPVLLRIVTLQKRFSHSSLANYSFFLSKPAIKVKRGTHSNR